MKESQEQISITVFTPTFNRGRLLFRVLDSLKAQSFKNFEWLIVDDGSNDDTPSIMESIINDNKDLSIRYYKKNNGGKHTAINYGVNLARGELFFILDSDDLLPEDSLEVVVTKYAAIRHNEVFAGVGGLDCYVDNRPVSIGMNMDEIDCSVIELRNEYHVKGDMKEVFRTSIMKGFPFPEIPREILPRGFGLASSNRKV
jgi:glycosyltransferase involved in cell wall biosynthesis